MFQLLYKYLIINQEVSIPGIGSFSFTRKPATFDFNNRLFVAPSSQISFNEVANVPVDGLHTFISNEQKIEKSEAIQKLNDFISRLKEDLSVKETVQLPGLGILFRNEQGELKFESSQEIQDYFPDVSAERITTQSADLNPAIGERVLPGNEVRKIVADKEKPAAGKRNNWWIYAVILAVIAVAAIVYYYTLNGSLE